jgi:hypothetical protein
MNHRGVHQSNGAGQTTPSQVRPHLARFGRTTARSGCKLARLGRTTAGRSWPEPAAGRLKPAAGRPEPAATGQSQPQLATAGHTWLGLGFAAALGAPAPTKCHVSGPRHQQSHEQVLDGRETLILCQLDQKAKIGSTWIDGPTLNRCNRHQGVILDVPQHCQCITL